MCRMQPGSEDSPRQFLRARRDAMMVRESLDTTSNYQRLLLEPFSVTTLCGLVPCCMDGWIRQDRTGSDGCYAMSLSRVQVLEKKSKDEKDCTEYVKRACDWIRKNGEEGGLGREW